MPGRPVPSLPLPVRRGRGAQGLQTRDAWMAPASGLKSISNEIREGGRD
jgi:hypothetical protein